MWAISKVFIEFATYCFCFALFGFLALRHVDLSSPTGDQTHTSLIGRRSLNHWTTRKVSKNFLAVTAEQETTHTGLL